MEPSVGLWVGRFRLQRALGEGGMATVWLAQHAVTNKLVAIKILRAPFANDAECRSRFMREARAAATVRHVNVVDVHDVLELEDGTPTIVMEYLEGESLEARLAHQGAFFLHDIVAVLSQVCAALGAAHAAGIIHRDLKPANIFLARGVPGSRQAGPLVKVLDFGLAKIASETGQKVTQPGAVLGTPAYMSPEQIMAEKNIDGRADIWALGVILYECLAAKRPIDADTAGRMLKLFALGTPIEPLTTHRPDLPSDIVELVHAMLSLDPTKRPASARDVLVVLEKHRKLSSSAGTEATARSAMPPVMLDKLKRSK